MHSGPHAMKNVTFIFVVIILPLFYPAVDQASEPGARIYHAQGEMAGEVTQTSVILQSRLTSVQGLEDGDVRGAAGWGRFEYAGTQDFAGAVLTEWIEAKEENDFIIRQRIGGLHPGQTCYYRLIFGADKSKIETGTVRRFRTLAAEDHPVGVRFVVGNCANYAFFFNGPKGDGRNARADEKDRKLGYPSMESILKLDPDFYIGAGDNVYYDHPARTAARTQQELRRKWHEQFVLPRVVETVGQMATFWIKDDHDYRYNDADGTGNKAPSHELGIRTFREQMPVVTEVNSPEVTYRTARCGRLLQLWMVEGRDYRSPNGTPDGPAKTIWGVEQKEWLKRTILASDALFKILVSPTPMIGPDDAYKSDNHAGGFRHEGEEFLGWLESNRQKNFYIITGDRHWHYHSVHSTGCEEFACGALNTENSRLGRAPGDPKSTDPRGKVAQLYTDDKPTGGYILVEVLPSGGGDPAGLRFSIQNERGMELYSVKKSAR